MRAIRAGVLCAAAVVMLWTCGATPTAAADPTSSIADLNAPVAGWRWPIDPPRHIVRPFEAPATRYSAGHRGVDIAAVGGAPVYAVADGSVKFTGTVVDRPVITLEHPGDLLSSIEPVTAQVAVGTSVHAGQRIGTVAGGGHCDGRCIHFGVRLSGEYVSPLLYLGGIERAVLLPLR